MEFPSVWRGIQRSLFLRIEECRGPLTEEPRKIVAIFDPWTPPPSPPGEKAHNFRKSVAVKIKRRRNGFSSRTDQSDPHPSDETVRDEADPSPGTVRGGAKTNSQGKYEVRKDDTLHPSVVGGGRPASCLLTSAKLHESQAAPFFSRRRRGWLWDAVWRMPPMMPLPSDARAGAWAGSRHRPNSPERGEDPDGARPGPAVQGPDTGRAGLCPAQGRIWTTDDLCPGKQERDVHRTYGVLAIRTDPLLGRGS